MALNPESNKFEKARQITQEEFDKLSDQLSDMHSQLVKIDGSPIPKHWTVFKVGELITIKDYTFKVAYIGESNILFEPVRAGDIKCEP